MDHWRATWAIVISLLANSDVEALPAAEEALTLARDIGGPGALMEAAHATSRARQAANDLDGARAVLDETFAQLDPARMTIQRDAIARLETRRAEVAIARGDLETARSSAAMAVRLAPKEHVETRTAALLAAAALALIEERTEAARGLIAEAGTLVEPTEYRDLRAMAQHMAGLVAARAPAG
jgi:ATP/maltotriose-dependent transcriptional regulator MalT